MAQPRRVSEIFSIFAFVALFWLCIFYSGQSKDPKLTSIRSTSRTLIHIWKCFTMNQLKPKLKAQCHFCSSAFLMKIWKECWITKHFSELFHVLYVTTIRNQLTWLYTYWTYSKLIRTSLSSMKFLVQIRSVIPQWGSLSMRSSATFSESRNLRQRWKKWKVRKDHQNINRWENICVKKNGNWPSWSRSKRKFFSLLSISFSILQKTFKLSARWRTDKSLHSSAQC